MQVIKEGYASQEGRIWKSIRKDMEEYKEGYRSKKEEVRCQRKNIGWRIRKNNIMVKYDKECRS